MALNYLTVVLDLYDGQGNPEIRGSAALVPSAVLTDAGAEVIGQDPVPVVFHSGGLPQVKLLATDNSGPVPGGWTWGITFTGQAGPPAGFSFFLPANSMTFTATNATPCVFTGSGTAYVNGTGVQLSGGSLPAGFSAGTTYYVVSASGSTFELAATAGGSPLASTGSGSGSVIAVSQFLSNLIPVSSGTAFQAYMPLPTGTPNSGQVPVATGSGEASAWGNVATNPMTTSGDTVYGGSAGAPTRLAGDTSNTRKFLREQSSAGTAQPPAWDTIQAGDVPTLNQNTSGTAAGLSSTLAIGSGGTGQTAAAAAYNALSPMTTTGDIEYESGANTAARLAGPTSSTKQFLTSTGTGAAAQAPAWGTIAAADLPAANTSTQGAVILDGTASDIQPPGTPAAGSKGQAADAKHVHALSSIPTSAWPSGALAQTVQIGILNSSALAVASGTMQLFAVMLQAGQTVSNITFLIGTTAGLTLTHGWYALLADSTFTQLAHSADQTSGGLTASTMVTKAMTTPYAVTSAGKYWVAITVVAGTQPTLAAETTLTQAAAAFSAFPVAGAGSTGLTGPGTDGSTTYVTPSAAGGHAYAYVS